MVKADSFGRTREVAHVWKLWLRVFVCSWVVALEVCKLAWSDVKSALAEVRWPGGLLLMTLHALFEDVVYHGVDDGGR
ncbi:MAG: hypothetical protein HY098_09030 [Nitrospinae bacterium]|nr:hypothetical protein [Nitrospinota bacterium]